MPRTRLTTTDLHDAVHKLLDEDPLRADQGHPEYRLFVYHGKPVGLDGQLLHGFGASLSQLKDLAAALDSVSWEWEDAKHPLRRRFTPLAWMCLSRLSGGGTPGAWANSHRLTFGPRRPYLGAEWDRSIDRKRRPWLYDAAEFDQPQNDRAPHPGCSQYE